jgi:hypothetical protein
MWLRKSPLIRATKHRIERHLRGEDNVALVSQLAMYAPLSFGTFKDRAPLTILAVQQTFPLLAELLQRTDRPMLSPITIAEYCANRFDQTSMATLKRLLDTHGSDKCNFHNYHMLYAHILRNPGAIRRILEIGLGTNNDDVVSNMGLDGRPGASLRAFRDFLPNAQVFGADVDRRILFAEDRIVTAFVDQTDLSTFDSLGGTIGADFDLIIDDGLHAPNANLATLIFALERLRVGGWVVIEDIAPASSSLWQVVAQLLPDGFRPALLSADEALVFVVERQA